MKKYVFTRILIFMIILSCFSSCGETGGNTGKESFTNTQLAENILKHIDEWEIICDSYTKNYTYDDVEATGMCLYTANTQGRYYLGVLYTIKTNISYNSYTQRTYQRVYSVTDSKFQYMYGSEYSTTDKTVKNYELLSYVTFSSKEPSKKERVKQLAHEGLEAEQKYFKEITLGETSTITLSRKQQQLFDNMYKAIKSLEYYDPRSANSTSVPLAKIEYYITGSGECEALLYHGYSTELGGSYYVGGYLMNDEGHRRLSYSDEEKLENTSKLIKLEWNVKWTEEKKEYMLKQSIYKNYP